MRTDLESQYIESLWVEIRNPKTPGLLVGYVYRNPAATCEWYDEFVTMLDKVSESKNKSFCWVILILTDLNPTWLGNNIFNHWSKSINHTTHASNLLHKYSY